MDIFGLLNLIGGLSLFLFGIISWVRHWSAAPEAGCAVCFPK